MFTIVGQETKDLEIARLRTLMAEMNQLNRKLYQINNDLIEAIQCSCFLEQVLDISKYITVKSLERTMAIEIEEPDYAC